MAAVTSYLSPGTAGRRRSSTGRGGTRSSSRRFAAVPDRPRRRPRRPVGVPLRPPSRPALRAADHVLVSPPSRSRHASAAPTSEAPRSAEGSSRLDLSEWYPRFDDDVDLAGIEMTPAAIARRGRRRLDRDRSRRGAYGSGWLFLLALRRARSSSAGSPPSASSACGPRLRRAAAGHPRRGLVRPPRRPQPHGCVHRRRRGLRRAVAQRVRRGARRRAARRAARRCPPRRRLPHEQHRPHAGGARRPAAARGRHERGRGARSRRRQHPQPHGAPAAHPNAHRPGPDGALDRLAAAASSSSSRLFFLNRAYLAATLADDRRESWRMVSPDSSSSSAP